MPGIKFAIAIIWDIIDAFNVIPFASIITDIIGLILSLVLWGPIGFLYLLELIPNVLPGLNLISPVPTVTLIGILSKVSKD